MSLGWNNHRKAIRIPDHLVVILVDGSYSSVLTGEVAKGFLDDHRCLEHHLCGVRRSAFAEALVASVGRDPHRVAVNDFLFDRYFGLGLMQKSA